MRDSTAEESRLEAEARIQQEARLQIEIELIAARRIDEAIQEAVKRVLSVERFRRFLLDEDPLFALYPTFVARYGDDEVIDEVITVVCEVDDPPLSYVGNVPIYGHPCVAELAMKLEAEIASLLEGAIARNGFETDPT